MDVKNDYVRTHVTRDPDLGVLAGIFAELEGQAVAALEREGFTSPVCRRSADLRYYGQAYEVRVAAPPGPLGEEWRAEVLARFHEAHERLYGYAYRDDPRHAVEWVNLRVSGIGPITRPAIPERPGRAEAALTARGGRPVCFDEREGWTERPVHQRADLRRGDVVSGPAVIEEYGSTLPLHPGFTAECDAHGNLVIRRHGAGEPGTSTSTKGQSR
ncbi:hypothetical protein [Nonomuraea dietziae]|uniref:hypothetical protein n=1 Tax=Nonomuraea dietziae TaxID=65515 RepID=UPI0031D0CE1F